jgi:hypothetical protein
MSTAQVADLEERWPPQALVLVDRKINLNSDRTSWSPAHRILESADCDAQVSNFSFMRVRDLAVVRVEDIGQRSSIVNIDNGTSRVYPHDLLRISSNRYAIDATVRKPADTHESSEAFDAGYETQSLPRILFRAIGFGLGIAGLCIMALTLAISPVLVVEPNQWIRDVELFWIGVGLMALVAELFVTKRDRSGLFQAR